MSRSSTTLPECYARIVEALTQSGIDASVPGELGELARLLAASKPGGTFLCLGQGAGEVGAWILDGMDLSSRLVIVVADGAGAELLGRELEQDLRASVHVQDSVTFLGDVREHRFDLIADPLAAQGVDACAAALGQLGLGGVYLSLRPLEELGGAPFASDEYVASRISPRWEVTMVARRMGRPEPKRRGGRRSTQAVTPLFSSRRRRRGD